MLPVPFLENVSGCLRCHKSLSPLKTHPDTKQASPKEAEKLRGAWRDAEWDSEDSERVYASERGGLTRVPSRLIFSASAKNTSERPSSCRPALLSTLMPQQWGPWGRRPWERRGCWCLPVCCFYWEGWRGRGRRKWWFCLLAWAAE